MKSLFEELGGTYRREGDYLVPDLSLPSEDSEIRIGKYGRMLLGRLATKTFVQCLHSRRGFFTSVSMKLNIN